MICTDALIPLPSQLFLCSHAGWPAAAMLTTVWPSKVMLLGILYETGVYVLMRGVVDAATHNECPFRTRPRTSDTAAARCSPSGPCAPVTAWLFARNIESRGDRRQQRE